MERWAAVLVARGQVCVLTRWQDAEHFWLLQLVLHHYILRADSVFVSGLVRCEMAKEVILSLQRVISHNDGLTESTLYVPHHILLNAPQCVNTWPFAFPVFDLGDVFTDVAQCAGEVTPPGISISW